VPTLEEIVYEAGRHALAEQERFVAALRFGGMLALVALAVGLVAGTVLLGPWRVRFSLDPRRIRRLQQISPERRATDHLVIVGIGYQRLRDRNDMRVRRMSLISVVLCASVVVQALGWLGSLL